MPYSLFAIDHKYARMISLTTKYINFPFLKLELAYVRSDTARGSGPKVQLIIDENKTKLVYILCTIRQIVTMAGAFNNGGWRREKRGKCYSAVVSP